jgi:hypothetical protein
MRSRTTLIPFLFAIIILSAYSSLLTTRRVGADIAYPTVSVSPAAQVAAVGEQVNVSIVISNAVDLFVYQVFVSYSPETLSVLGVTEGNLLKRAGAYETFCRAVFSNTGGLVQVANSLFRGAQPVTGGGEAFTITFTVNKPGGSALLVHDVAMKNQFNINLEPIFTQNGTLSTAAIEVTPNRIRPTVSNDLSVNKTFNVNVTLAGTVSELYGYDLNVTYNIGILQATAATLLPLMGTPNTNLTLIDNSGGTVRLSLECTSPAPSTNVTGTLATIAFKVLSLGDTNIEISENSTVVDINGNGVFPLLGSASFKNQYANRNIGIVSSTLSSYEADAGDNLTDTIIMRNDGSTNETYEVIVHAYGPQSNITTLVAGPSTFTIGSNTTDTITMTLETTGMSGNYTLQAFIYYLPEETTYQDNTYTVLKELQVQAAPEESSLYGTTFYVAVAAIVILIAIVAAYMLLRRRKAS